MQFKHIFRAHKSLDFSSGGNISSIRSSEPSGPDGPAAPDARFVPQFCHGTRRHQAVGPRWAPISQVERLCFAGNVCDTNWEALKEVLDPNGALALPEAGRGQRGGKTRPAVEVKAPKGSALIGATIYGLAGAGGAEMGLWSR